MKTYLPKEAEIERKWFVVDAKGKILGKLAVEIANVLRGRHKPTYTPHLDTGDHVVVINADLVEFTGNKSTDKVYQNYSGHMGGQKEWTAKEIRERDPNRLIKQAVWGMIPSGKLGRQCFRKLKVYSGSENQLESMLERYKAQKPEVLDI